ncbi:spore coat protein A [Methylobacterium sp. BE186]|uniref:multicopper oxidase family protein n=1 Tax=Methylobacterium sp. BE186 TaxID=2817715 RepID=UPI002861E6DE|nr:multicopper oxidase domain-containing protein [Methylobacterium sp. BE186]MDR7037273.1 spore coat protein A [Methylobacterium sp. BE186]
MTATIAPSANPSGATTLLDPASQPRFVNALPNLPRIDATCGGRFVIEERQFDQWLGLVDPSGAPLLTPVWGYGLRGHDATYPGPTIDAQEGVPIAVKWVNKLPATGPLLPVDTSIHMNDGEREALAQGLIPTVVHRHGGHHSAESDGYPEAWFTQGFGMTGPSFTSPWDSFPNDQQAATLWYHDHALGLTRINVGSGLAGLYRIHDAGEQRLIDEGVLPDARHDIEAIVQDRAFTADGGLYLPAYPDDPIPGTDHRVADELPPDYAGPFPTVLPEFFGDHLLVNGMAWPTFEARPGQYAFHALNASDSRTYLLTLDDPSVTVTLVGTDGGLLPQAITVMDGDGVQEPGEEILLAPSDRVDLVFDFSHAGGHSVTLRNVGPDFSPFQGFNADGSLAGEETRAATPDQGVGEVMRFEIANGPAEHDASVADGSVLNRGFVPLDPNDAVETRQLGLFEQEDEFGRVMPMLGVAQDTRDIAGDPVPFGPLHWDHPVTEDPTLGTTEIWNFYNFTEDTHPVHVHQVEYQVLGKSKIVFTDAVNNAGPSAATPDGLPDDLNGDGRITIGTIGEAPGSADILVGDPVPLRPEELGAQDTVTVGPGEMLSTIMHFDLPGTYVWHCHILSHEDNEMMRPFTVVDPGLLA